MKQIMTMMFGLTLAFSASANGPGAVRKTIEASMQVTGEILISSDGALQSYELDKPELLPEDVKLLLAKYLPACEFEVKTASGKPGIVKARMALQIVAKQAEDGGSLIMVRDSAFEDPKTPQLVLAKKMQPPNYPMSAAQAGVAGTVYVVLRLNPDGTVAEAHAEQVDMKVVANERELSQWRERLAKAALVQARKWAFEISPQRSSSPGDVAVRVPVAFFLDGMKPVEYGKWNSYVPGPHAPIPWNLNLADDGVGAMMPGKIYPLDSPIKLRNPPNQG